jgi:hypothetical protein
MKQPKLTTAVLAAALLACMAWLGIMLISPVMGAYALGGTSTCGGLGGLLSRGGETRNNGGDISAEQFDQRIDDCRAATIRQSAVLALPIGLGVFSWWGAMTVSAKARTEAGG